MEKTKLAAYRLSLVLLEAIEEYRREKDITKTKAVSELIENGILVWLQGKYSSDEN